MLTHIMENSGSVVVGIAIKAAVSAGVVLANISAKETGTPLPCRGMGWHEKSLSYGIFNDLLRKTPFCIHMASDKGISLANAVIEPVRKEGWDIRSASCVDNHCIPLKSTVHIPFQFCTT